LTKGRKLIIGFALLAVLSLAGLGTFWNRVVEDPQAAFVGVIQAGDIAAMERHLAAGADANREWMLNSPLGWAVDAGQSVSARFLLAKGADVNAHFGLPNRTALQQAAERGNFELVRLLVEAGADINAKNKFGRTALYHARRSNAPDDLIKYLQSKGGVE
jgi:ankyrin repeat protein